MAAIIFVVTVGSFLSLYWRTQTVAAFRVSPYFARKYLRRRQDHGTLRTPLRHSRFSNLHISGLFNFSGKPWLSQKWMRTICNEFYGTEEIHGYGYGQDEDQGQLGAWLVVASMGTFDVKGLTLDPSFQLCSHNKV